MTRARALVAGLIALLILAGAASAGGTLDVWITTPTAWQSFSASQTPTLTVTGGAAFTTPVKVSTRFYLRRDGCGSTNDNPHLSVTSGTDAGEGCGFVGGNGFVSTVSKGLFSVDFPTSDGMPVYLDTSRGIDGVLDLQNDVAGTGQVTLDFTLEALVNGEGIVVGTGSENVLVTPAQSDYPVTFHITPTRDLEGATISGLDLNVYPHGAYSDSGYIGISGKSFVNVPGYSVSPNRSVQISIDDPGFGSPVAATLAGDGHYTASVPMPAVGNHTIYSRAAQGFAYSTVKTMPFGVTQ